MTRDDFRRRAHDARASGTRALIRVWREVLLDTETPVSAFAKLRRDGGPFAFLLESPPAGGKTWARHTLMGSAPRAAWRLTDGGVEAWTPEPGLHNARRPKHPLPELMDLLTRDRTIAV